jgi:excisionase family DNA binding protein
MIESRALSVKEVCEKIGVSKPTVYKLINERKLPSFHVGKRHLVLATDLDAFIEQQKEKELG